MAPERGTQGYFQRAKRQRYAELARAEIMKRNFSAFVLGGGWATLEGAKPLEWTPFLQGICDEAQAMFEGWLVANGRATDRQRAATIARWEMHGAPFVEGSLLVQNEIYNLPPGTLKSTLLMVLFCAWVWLTAPDFKFGCFSQTDDLVKRDSNAHRDLVTSPWYRRTFRIKWKIKGTSDAVGKWKTTAGGERTSKTILASPIGLHVDCLLIDDPDDAKRVWGEPARRAVHEQITKGLENRVVHEKLSLRMVLQQIVHSDCASYYLRALSMWSPTNRTGWASFVVPLQYGQGPGGIDHLAPASGWKDSRTTVGEFMQESRFGAAELADKIIKLGQHGVDAYYNQNALVIDGGWFPRAMWRFFRVQDALPGEPGFFKTSQPADPRPRPVGCLSPEEAPPFILERDKLGKIKIDWLTITIDSTFGSLDAKTASAVGFLVAAGQGLRRFIFHDATDLMTFLSVIKLIKETLKRFPARRVLIELKANGSSVIETLQREVADGLVLGPDGKPIIVVVEGVNAGSENYLARAQAMRPAVEAGLWYVLEGAHWLPPFFAEVCVFPNGKRDDRIDSMSQLATYYSDSGDTLRRALALSRW